MRYRQPADFFLAIIDQLIPKVVSEPSSPDSGEDRKPSDISALIAAQSLKLAMI